MSRFQTILKNVTEFEKCSRDFPGLHVRFSTRLQDWLNPDDLILSEYNILTILTDFEVF